MLKLETGAKILAKSSEPEIALAAGVSDYAQLFEQHQGALIRYLYGMVNDPETACDLAQEAFGRGYRLWLENPAREGWRPLLYKIATNCAIDLLRRNKKIKFSPLPEYYDEEQSGNVALYGHSSLQQPDPTTNLNVRMAVQETLRQLDPAAATCLLLHYDHGFSCDEIAAITGSSVAAIWQRLSRARRQFCSLYRKEQGDD